MESEGSFTLRHIFFTIVRSRIHEFDGLSQLVRFQQTKSLGLWHQAIVLRSRFVHFSVHFPRQLHLCFSFTKPCIVQGRDPRGWVFPDGWTASTEVKSISIDQALTKFNPFRIVLVLHVRNTRSSSRKTESTFSLVEKSKCKHHTNISTKD